MAVVARDYRQSYTGRYRIDAMLHDSEGGCFAQWGHYPHWRLHFPSIEEAEAAIGDEVYTCQVCLPGRGRQIVR